MQPILVLALLGLGWVLPSDPTALNPAATAVSTAAAVSTATLTIDTYPFANFLETHHSDAYNIDYPWLDRSAYEASDPQPAPHDYTALIVENSWLRLTFLPELGGRLYGVTVKATGGELLYQNPVIKPTPWGPEDDLWWLAVGGIEWCLPVEEHGYEWAVPWSYSVTTTAAGATVALWDSTATDRIRARITVFLPADRAAFEITPRLENPTTGPIAFKFWENAMLAPRGNNAVGNQTRFVLPIDQVTVHSRGDGYLPGPGEAMSWPLYNGTDYSQLGNWNQWLGFFARPQAAADWAGVYAQGDRVQRGVVRVFPHEVAVGVKGFGFGWADPIPASNWTDDGSTYVELHGGPSPTFWDSITLQAGGSLAWTETWLPLRDLPALSVATADAALGLDGSDENLEFGVVAAAQQTDLSLRLWRAADCTSLWREDGLSLAPGTAYTHHLAGLGLEPGDVWLAAYDGDTLLAAIGTCADAYPPPESQVDPLASVQTSASFQVTWSGTDSGGGLASYDLQVRDGDAGAPWTDWLLATTATSATFDGQDGHTYTFRSRARDLSGAVEAWPANDWDDTFTTVLLGPAPVLITSAKVAQPLHVGLGDVIEFQVHLANTGNLAASVQISDPLPACLALTSGPTSNLPPDPTFDGSTNTIAWNGSLPAGQIDATIFFETKVLCLPPGGTISNTVWIDDGVHPPLLRQVAVSTRWQVYLPIILK